MPSQPDSKREQLRRIIFMSDTPGGRAFDVALLWCISLSVITIMLESVDGLRDAHWQPFAALDWLFTVLFTVEYLARLWAVQHRLKYALSFFGLVDLLSILPAYVELLVPGTHYLMILRILRLMRMFRILKMAEYMGEARVLLNALAASRRKILLFFAAMLALVCVEGTVVYVLEHDANPDFANIPQGIYWAIVTITTVGYGDVAPVTVLGKMMASVIMLTGFAIIAVPTGIVTTEIGLEMRGQRQRRDRRCPRCGGGDNLPEARYCHRCGEQL